MNNLNIPAVGNVKICSACLRILSVKYFLKDSSRLDRLSCNCISCLFRRSEKYKSRFPELWEHGRFPKAKKCKLPIRLRRKTFRHPEKLAT